MRMLSTIVRAISMALKVWRLRLSCRTRPDGLPHKARASARMRHRVSSLAPTPPLAGVRRVRGAATDMIAIGLNLSGDVRLPEGSHLLTAGPALGLLGRAGGREVRSCSCDCSFEASSGQFHLDGGLYAVDLDFGENTGDQGLRLEPDADAGHFFRPVADWQAALDAKGPMPAAGLLPTCRRSVMAWWAPPA